MQTLAKEVVSSPDGLAPLGPYSPAVKLGSWVFLSGQIASDLGDPRREIEGVFDRLEALIQASSGRLSQVVKLTIYVTDLSIFSELNAVMMRRFQAPYPARATVQVSALPKGALIEIDAILNLDIEK